MNLENIFCPNLNCPARGQIGQGNIKAHSQKDKRCRCTICRKTFSIRKGTLFHWLKTDPQQVILVLTLLAHGCPLQAIVAAFGYDERTVKGWLQKAGAHCGGVHDHIIGASKLDLQQVQADEIKAKTQGGSLWLAMAMMVSTRLWLGGVSSPKRDRALIDQLAGRLRAMALCRPLLLAVDGLPSYVGAFQRAFRTKAPRWGQLGRCKLVAWPDIAIVQVIKRRLPTGLEIERRIVQGCSEQVERLRRLTQGHSGVINTAYIERLNATFRQQMACLARRTRHLARQPQTLEAGMFLVGCCYNFCQSHDSLRLQLWITAHRYRWVQRTPAMAAGLTDHVWSVRDLLMYKVPPPRWTPPKRRGRPSNELKALILRWC